MSDGPNEEQELAEFRAEAQALTDVLIIALEGSDMDAACAALVSVLGQVIATLSDDGKELAGRIALGQSGINEIAWVAYIARFDA